MTTATPSEAEARRAEWEADKAAADALINLQINVSDEDDRKLWTLRQLLVYETRDELGIQGYLDNDHSPELDCTPDQLRTLVDQLNRMRAEKWGLGRETLTTLALRQSLCPLHYIDYAACFDEDDLECVQIRTIHPNHDT